jgi:hypothetical protein
VRNKPLSTPRSATKVASAGSGGTAGTANGASNVGADTELTQVPKLMCPADRIPEEVFAPPASESHGSLGCRHSRRRRAVPTSAPTHRPLLPATLVNRPDFANLDLEWRVPR